ncbi:CYTH domain protein [Bacillus sp. THAF10]|uniref:CYTH domain-containing protein n=1 Tax=Bacillus sp. THAF10 TaxID=2587848 RepID=UPI0012682661|nr:CYTH domain-containing protein [Bacillus sp. THAF10]QFT88396.1 CYTH domain protein [Bacillus sp. THAF10]
MSHQELEIEFKNLLTFDEFTSLCSAFKVEPEHFFEQVNYYFDTQDFSLKSKGCALRVRILGESHTLTLKQPAKDGKLETHQAISEDDFHHMQNHGGIVDGAIFTIVKEELMIDPSSFTFFGSLKTNRVEVPYQDGLLVLDESHYLDTSDFELEYEVKSYEKGKEVFQELLNAYGITVRDTKNKVARFYEAKGCSLKESGDLV